MVSNVAVRLAYAMAGIRLLIALGLTVLLYHMLSFWASTFLYVHPLPEFLLSCALVFVFVGMPWAMCRAVVTRVRWARRRCLVCGKAMGDAQVCAGCGAEWGDDRAPRPERAAEEGWEALAKRGAQWTGWSKLCSSMVLLVGFVGMLSLREWMVNARHFAEQDWFLTRAWLGVLILGIGAGATMSTRGLLLSLESERRRFGVYRGKAREARRRWGMALGLGSVVSLLTGAFLARGRTYHSAPDTSLDLALLLLGLVMGIAVLLMALFGVRRIMREVYPATWRERIRWVSPRIVVLGLIALAAGFALMLPGWNSSPVSQMIWLGFVALGVLCCVEICLTGWRLVRAIRSGEPGSGTACGQDATA